MTMPTALKLANLTLLILFPIAWFAPLMKSGILPFLSLTENSVASALQGIWQHDIFLALLMTFFAIFAPYTKVVGVALIQFDLMSPRLMPALSFVGRLAMADVFLIAIYIVLYTDITIAGVTGRVETAWGLYLFSACVIASYTISFLSHKAHDV